MKFLILLTCTLLSATSFGASKTLAKCSVNKVGNYEGARVNLLETEDGKLKANLIFGTTVSGQMYHVTQVSSGVFVGSVKNQPQFRLKLVISTIGKANSYVNGYAASLEATSPSLNSSTGMKSVKTTANDEFVCGKFISRF